VIDFGCEGDRFFDERSGWSDLPEHPLCDGEVCPPTCADIPAETESGPYDRARIVNAQRLNQVRLRLDEISLEEAGKSH
jgi:hypothetical protein